MAVISDKQFQLATGLGIVGLLLLNGQNSCAPIGTSVYIVNSLRKHF
jgi:hypothetical protein